MRPAADAASAEQPAPAPARAKNSYELRADAAPHEARNFLVMALYQVVMRTGWIFKTESIIMPAVLDTITGGGPLGGLLRGCLPVLNRFGHSIPPLLFSRRLKVLPQKRWAVLVCTILMASMFAVLSGMWWVAGSAVYWWMPLVFLAAYTCFFMATGVNNLAFGTMQGKLIHATRRGRLLLVANTVGAASAIVAVALLLPMWLTSTGGQFQWIFGFTAFCFALSAVCILLTIEPRDNYNDVGRGVRHLFASAWLVVRDDHNFRRLALVAMAFGSSLALFPHYQALGRSDRLGLSFDNLILWVIVQNAGTALFSLLIGPLADQRGNRLILRLVMIGVACMPPTAILLSHLPAWGWTQWGQALYPGVFLFIGLTPVGFKTLNNYTLEISPPHEHPRYLSTLSLCLALPLFFSPLLGYLVVITSFEAVFFTISAAVFAGWLMTFTLAEPRHHLTALGPATVVPEDD